ncbi:MAG TPA: sigma-70 family RNA polymerase sigma factor [Tissierellaceae bacterium]
MELNKEKDLVKRLKKGHEEAYVEVINLYGNRLLKTCYLILKDRHETEDVVQETFFRLFRQIDSFKENSSIYTWIYQIALNLCRDRLKAGKDTALFESIAESDEKVEDTVIESIDRDILRKELKNLDDLYREVLILFYYEELSIKEISKILNEKEGTIKSRLSRGRTLLKKAIEKGGELSE